uniref:Uncharacterized protein n=1 Tax=Cyprinus carpio carpio TaxID=630221 RepID=A0A9J7YLP6_CYPCA
VSPMSWDFIVPVCLDDLVESGAVNQYVVQDVLSAKQLPSHINSFKVALRSQGPLCILEHFDTAKNCRTVDVAVKEDMLELLIQGWNFIVKLPFHQVILLLVICN